MASEPRLFGSALPSKRLASPHRPARDTLQQLNTRTEAALHALLEDPGDDGCGARPGAPVAPDSFIYRVICIGWQSTLLGAFAKAELEAHACGVQVISGGDAPQFDEDFMELKLVQ